MPQAPPDNIVIIGGPAHLCMVAWPSDTAAESVFRIALNDCPEGERTTIFHGPAMKAKLPYFREATHGPMMHYELIEDNGERAYIYSPQVNGWWWCFTCKSDVSKPCNH